MAKVIPDECTSFGCTGELGSDYCRECSHAIFYGRSKINTKLWRWEFRPHYGFSFVDKDKEPIGVSPHNRHPVWKRFEAWQKRRGLK